MPRSTQKKLIRQTKALGYRGNTTGMCHGIACMAAQAILIDDIVHFDKRINFLLNYDSSKIAADVASAKKKIKESKALSLTDRKLLESLGFFEGTELYHHPRRYTPFLDKNVSTTQSFLNILPIAFPEKLKSKADKVEQAAQFTNIFDQNKMEKFLHELENITATHAFPIPVIVSANNHAITISYKRGTGWLFADPNQLPSKTIHTTNEMAKQVMTAFNLKNQTHQKLAMSLEMYSADPLDKKTRKRLTSLYQKQLSSINRDTATTVLPNVSQTYGSLLSLAASTGDDAAVKRLIQHGAPVTKETFELAIRHDNLSTFQLLAKSKSLNDTNYASFLITAICANSRKITESLLSQNPKLADITTSEPRNPTPLFVAIEHKHTRLVELLLTYPIDLEKKNHLGGTPLLHAAEDGNYNVVKMLMKHNVDLTVKNKEGEGLLWLTALSHNKKLLSLVIKKLKPANLNPKNGTGTNLIHELLTNPSPHAEKNWKIAEYLLLKGARLNRKEASQLRHDYSLTIKHKKAAKLGYTHLAELLTPKPAGKTNKLRLFEDNPAHKTLHVIPSPSANKK